MDPFVAEVRIMTCNFAPSGWANCYGQLMPISQNTALFALVGTYYGGDGKSTFALPNLQGRFPVHQGQGASGREFFLGEDGGSETVTLLETELPAHNHQLRFADVDGTTGNPASSANLGLANTGDYSEIYTNGTSLVAMHPSTISVAGSSLPHNNMQPYLTLNFCIALQGVFPPRS